MQDITINSKDKIIMKLLHYFITDKGYNPVILHGIKDEIWLENLNSEYKIIRIVSNYIHNEEQLNLDIFRTQKVLKTIQKKTLVFNMEALSIFIDLGDNVTLKQIDNIDLVSIEEEGDLENSKILQEKFPDINQKTNFSSDGMDLLIKLTSDINKNRESENTKVEEVFKEKKPLLTPILIILNLLIFLNASIIGNEYFKYLFFNNDIYYLIIGMFCIYLLCTKTEGFYGVFKTLITCLFSITCGALIGCILDINPGYISCVFGLMGALINFGSYYRVYLNNVLKTLIVPLIVVNIAYVILSSNYYLILVGLVGGIAGFLISRSLGVKYKENKSDIINSTIMSIILLGSLILINFI